MCAGACVAAHGEGFVGYPPPPFPSPLLMAGSGEATSSSPPSSSVPKLSTVTVCIWGARGELMGRETVNSGEDTGHPGDIPSPTAGFDLHKRSLPPFSASLILPFLLQENKTSVVHRTQSLGQGNAVPAATALESRGHAVPPRELPEKSRPGWHCV